MNTVWTLNKAFCRNDGLISRWEQIALADKCVVIPGCGGIGSTVAETMVRLGVGKFRLCDPDEYGLANFNRQLGATVDTVGKNKAIATKERILLINPDAQVDIFAEPISQANAEQFIYGADVVLDGIDFFALKARRALFAAAYKSGAPAMTAAPLGFSASLHVFLPGKGMSFEEYFNFKENDNNAQLLAKFLLGLAPRALHRQYTDLTKINAIEQTGPSSILGTQLAATFIGGEVIRILLNRGHSLPAPWYRQIDIYRQCMVKKKLSGGNRHIIQLIKLGLARQAFKRSGVWQSMIEARL